MFCSDAFRETKSYWLKHGAGSTKFSEVLTSYGLIRMLLRTERQSAIPHCAEVETQQVCVCVCVCVSTVCDLETRCLWKEKYIPAGDGVSVCASSWEREWVNVCVFVSCVCVCVCVCVCACMGCKRKRRKREAKRGSVFDITNQKSDRRLHLIPKKALSPSQHGCTMWCMMLLSWQILRYDSWGND